MACGDAPRPPVRLHLIDRAALSFDARNELMRETLAPWRARGRLGDMGDRAADPARRAR